MKIGLVMAGVIAMGTLASAQDPSTTVLHVEAEKVTAALDKGGSLGAAPGLTLSATHRNGKGQVEVHETETDVLYIQEGAATLMTGGQMVGGKQTAPGQWRGTSITGGETHRVVKGEVYVIPAGVPHWFSDVPGSISYFVVKVLKK